MWNQNTATQQITFNMNLVPIIDASKKQNNLLHDMKYDCNLLMYQWGHIGLLLVETNPSIDCTDKSINDKV